MALGLEQKFWARVDKRGPDDCWPWIGAKSYGQMSVDGRSRRATHISVFLATGAWPAPGLVVCHACDNPPCVNPSHLFVGTVAENNADRDAKGRTPRGERHNRAILSDEAVMEIRTSKLKVTELAAKYGVSIRTIYDACHGDNWKHVELQSIRPRLKWKIDREEALRLHLDEGMTCRQLAERYGASIWSIKKSLRRARLAALSQPLGSQGGIGYVY